MKTLNLADNSVEDLAPKVFQMLTKLKSLDLSQNPLEDLQPDVFKDVVVSVIQGVQDLSDNLPFLLLNIAYKGS